MFYDNKYLITQSLAFYRHLIKGICKVIIFLMFCYHMPWTGSILFATGGEKKKKSPLIPLNLIRSENQLQITQNQFREPMLRVCSSGSFQYQILDPSVQSEKENY